MTANPEYLLRLAAERGATSPTAECLDDETLASGIAAAAIVAVVALPGGSVDDPSTHRAPTITAAASPVLIGPVGIVANARALRWTGVAGADHYRVTVFDATGGVVYETETSDTTVELPGSVSLERGGSYFWKVEARTGWNRWSASDLVEFSVQ